MPNTISHVETLHKQGAVLYCWSSGGAGYARESAREVGLEHCFKAFLPKPQVLIDDTKLANWRYLREIHPNACDSYSLEDYRKLLYTVS